MVRFLFPFEDRKCITASFASKAKYGFAYVPTSLSLERFDTI